MESNLISGVDKQEKFNQVRRRTQSVNELNKSREKQLLAQSKLEYVRFIMFTEPTDVYSKLNQQETAIGEYL